MNRKLEGVFTPHIVPLDNAGEVHESELRRYVDWLIERGVSGLYTNGSTGEFTRFTPEERRRIAEIVIDQAAGRGPVLVGAAEANTRETLRACEYYKTLGARAVAIVPPGFYPLDADQVYEYFAEIARHSPIDVTLYNIPFFAPEIQVPTAQRLAGEFERIVGIKDSSGSLDYLKQLIDAIRPGRPDFAILTGYDSTLIDALTAGCNGGTNATSGIEPEAMMRLYRLTREGQPEEARELQTAVGRLFHAMLDGLPFPEGFRLGVALRGFETGHGRQPISDAHRAKLEALRPKLEIMIEELEGDSHE